MAGVKTWSDPLHASEVAQSSANGSDRDRRGLARRMSPPLLSRDHGGTPDFAREPAAMRPLLHSTAPAVTSRTTPRRPARHPRVLVVSREGGGNTSLCPSVTRRPATRSALLRGSRSLRAQLQSAVTPAPACAHPLPGACALGPRVEPATAGALSSVPVRTRRFDLSRESFGPARLLEPRESFDDVHRSCGRGAAPRG